MYSLQTAYIHDENDNRFQIGDICRVRLKDENVYVGKIVNIENNDGDSWMTLDCSQEFEAMSTMIVIDDIEEIVKVETE